MAKVSPIQTNFNRGEVSPLIYGRVDLDPYRAGLKLCRNYLTLVQGGVTGRPGTYFGAEVKNSAKKTRLVPFEFSVTQAYIIEAGDLYFRFYRNNGQIESGGSPYEIATPYAEAHLFELKFTQSADVIYITHPSYAPRKLSRTGHTAWTLTTVTFLDGPYLSTNATSTTLTPSATVGTGVTITASAVTGINDGAGFQPTDIGRLIRIAGLPAEWVASTAYAKDAVVRNSGNMYVCTTAGTSAASGGPTGSGATISDDTCVWKFLEGSDKFWGHARITGRTSTTVVTVDVLSALGSTAAAFDWRLGLWSDTTGYPACVTFFEDRLFFAGTTNYPQRLDGSKSGDYENFAPTEVGGTIAADNAVAFTLNANTVNVIRWMLDDEKGLAVGTVGGEWIVRPSSQGEALSPTNITAKQATTYGSANVQPVRAGRAALFVQRAGRKVRELAYVFEVDGFRAPDMTVLSEHITRGGVDIQMAFQQEPQSIVWMARGDGALVGLTYEREQNVFGWHPHTLGGAFGAGDPVVESVACIPAANGTRDELWLVVKRTINGVTKRYVEYMTKIFEDDDALEDAFFVDCGLTYDGAATDTITGLDHLEGQVVTILADGATHPTRTVSSGSITLQREASKVQVGLGYEMDGQTLRPDAGAQDGTAQGKTKRIHGVTFRLHNTLGLKQGPSFDKLSPIIFRKTSDPLDAAPPLFSGDKTESFEGDYDKDAYVCWRQDQPLPSTILAVMPQLVTQDR